MNRERQIIERWTKPGRSDVPGDTLFGRVAEDPLV